MIADQAVGDIDQEADALLAELADDLLSSQNDTLSVGDEPIDDTIPSHIPSEVVDFVRTIARSQQTAARVIGQADERICRRLGRGDRSAQSSKRWRVAWTQEPERLKAFLGRLRDAHAFSAHQSMADSARFWTPSKLPKNLLPWRPNEAGALVIDDPAQVQPSFGCPAFLEPTPMKVIRYVYENWEARRAQSMGEDVCVSDFQKPKVWDLTAGGGTVGDYLAKVVGCTVIASDTTPVRDHINCAAAHQLGTIGSHTGFGGLAVVHEFVRRPDLVFLDPSSRGKPSVSDLYDGGGTGRDFADLTREQWVEVVSSVSRAAVSRLREGGLVSLLVRHGERRSGTVTPRPELLEQVKEVLAKSCEGFPDITIVSEVPIEFRQRRAQISLGRERVPATHLLLARSKW